jgi:hypothetical protein
MNTDKILTLITQHKDDPAYKKAASIICFDYGRTAKKPAWYDDLRALSNIESREPEADAKKVEVALLACGYPAKQAKSRSELAECGDRQIAYRRERKRTKMAEYRARNAELSGSKQTGKD